MQHVTQTDTPAADRYRITNDPTNPDSNTHLLEDGSPNNQTLCGTFLTDPQVIAGTTTPEQIPTLEEADNGDICFHCLRRAHRSKPIPQR